MTQGEKNHSSVGIGIGKQLSFQHHRWNGGRSVGETVRLPRGVAEGEILTDSSYRLLLPIGARDDDGEDHNLSGGADARADPEAEVVPVESEGEQGADGHAKQVVGA